MEPTQTELNPFKDDMSGKLLLGRYRIVRRLAAGGMGVVYLARTEGAEGFAKPVVLKLILPDFAEREQFVAMFVREAKILANIEDPGIVNVVDFSKEHNFYVMVLEYVHGFELREWIRYFESLKKQIPADIIIQIFIDVLDSLDKAHNCVGPDGKLLEIIHRDISPTNILISTDGRTKIVDFGIARMDEKSDAYEQSVAGFKGKYSYSAPERFSEVPANVQSDVYSVGVTLHETLLGRNEFFAKDQAATIAKVLSHTPSSVEAVRSDLPTGFDGVLGGAMAKDPQKRYKSAGEFADALRKIHPTGEREAHRNLLECTREYFTDEMSLFLGVEPLSSRVNAWRNPSTIPPPPDVDAEVTVAGGDNNRQPTAAAYATEEKTRAMASPQQSADRLMAESVTPIFDPRHPVGSAPLPRQGLSTFTKLLIFLGVLFVVGASVSIAYFVTRTQSKPTGQFLLVQSPAEFEEIPVADDPPPQSPSPAAETTPTAKEEDKAETNTLAEPTKKNEPKKRSARPVSEEQQQLISLTRAFKKHKIAIQSCFKKHKDAVEGIDRISILFTIDENGAVVRSRITPNQINGTPLGGCISTVAGKTKFPGQGAPLSFSIPVSVSM